MDPPIRQSSPPDDNYEIPCNSHEIHFSTERIILSHRQSQPSPYFYPRQDRNTETSFARAHSCQNRRRRRNHCHHRYHYLGDKLMMKGNGYIRSCTIGALLGCIIAFVSATTLAYSVSLKVFTVPRVKLGENATLLCHYELDGEKLYALKWYRDEREFYRFLPAERIEERKQAFIIPGIHVDLPRSNDRQVTLKNVTSLTPGNFKCEALVEGTFKSVAMERKMNIIDHQKVNRDQPNYTQDHHNGSPSSYQLDSIWTYLLEPMMILISIIMNMM